MSARWSKARCLAYLDSLSLEAFREANNAGRMQWASAPRHCKPTERMCGRCLEELNEMWRAGVQRFGESRPES